MGIYTLYDNTAEYYPCASPMVSWVRDMGIARLRYRITSVLTALWEYLDLQCPGGDEGTVVCSRPSGCTWACNAQEPYPYDIAMAQLAHCPF